MSTLIILAGGEQTGNVWFFPAESIASQEGLEESIELLQA
jgi:hypothetical protein